MTAHSKPLSYVQLLEANNLMQNVGDETYWLCVTRTVQGSKLFPVSAYIMFSYLNAFYRYPALLRKIEARMPAEEIADRSRNMGIKIQNSHMGWCLPAFYLLGREWLISLGMLRPQDAAEDIVYVLDFWKRFQLAWHRNDGHITNREYKHRAQILPDRRLEIFKGDMFECEPGDALHGAAQAFMATASQYGFLVSCESRISLTNSGPYRLDDRHQLLVRDFMDLAECSLPWLDGVAADVPHNNFTVTMSVRDCHFHLVDDWGSFESTPEFTADKLAGVGLYTSDPLTEGYVPLGMASREELTATFRELNEVMKDATNKLWVRMAEWTRDQLLDAGALTYFAVIKDLAHVAGVFEVEDWLEIDPRAERFRPLLNDEYGNSVLGELVGGLTLPSQQISPFAMMQHSDAATRMFTPLPLSILNGEDYVPSAGPPQPGTSNLDPKVDRYQTSRGRLTLAEYNRLAREHTPEICSDRYRFLCETWVKYNAGTPLAEELYKVEQRQSRTRQDRGTRSGEN
ncbi:hypothetical protein V6U71_04990 [Sphingopyxis sp. J-6]|uniref:hypothetical protein n=1 Tax=Sphingopyxis sp. J-6 TaxID=3122054 RepID=UPI0039844132